MVAGSHIGFDLDNIRTPAKCNCWSEVVLKFGLDRIHRFEDIVIFIFCRFGLKLPIHAHFFLGGGGGVGGTFSLSPDLRPFASLPNTYDHFMYRRGRQELPWLAKNPRRISLSISPWILITIPIPIPYPYPWESPWEFP